MAQRQAKAAKEKAQQKGMKTLATVDYKKWGHRYIDDLVRMGVDRNVVYRRLSRRMRMPHNQAHFSRTNNDPVLWKMVHQLEKMKIARQNEILNSIKLPKIEDPAMQANIERRRPKYKEVFTGNELLREVGRRNQWRKAPWYKKVILWLIRKSPDK